MYSASVLIFCGQVGSTRVVQVTGIIACVLAMFAKFGAVFATISHAVAGGVLLFDFGIMFLITLRSTYYILYEYT